MLRLAFPAQAILWLLALVGSWWLPVAIGAAEEPPSREQVRQALRKAVDYFRRQVATEGGYLWRYSEDLQKGEGERKATRTQVWVQPPGTPSVGLAFLAAYEAAGDEYYLEAARETARALVRGQFQSGGWDYHIEYDPKLRKQYVYRADGTTTGRNVTTLDDNTTQAAVRLLLRVDAALRHKDEAIREALQFALASLLKAQYPNGAWPQRYDRFPDPKQFPAKKASFPETWPREFPGKDYRAFYTLNDNALADVIDVMLEAARLTGEAKYRQAAERAGGFLLLAQLPEPQPGWAQQYDADMHPAWARKFEPPSVTGGESQGAMLTLLRLYRETGDRKYLEPIPRALAYYRRSLLPDGRLARFYELKTNKPLYFTKDYRLTYRDDDLPTHYAFKVASRLDAIAREYERLEKLLAAELKETPKRLPPRGGDGLAAQVKAVLKAMDGQGRWVQDGRLRNFGPDDPTRRILDIQTFIRNLGILSAYLAADRSAPAPKPKTVRLALIGDSTVASYPKPPADRPDLTGWGQVLGEFFGDGVEVLNHAASGRSSKSFLREGRWKPVLEAKPDYVFIQFGHNDQPGKGDRTTDPDTEFQENLRRYIRDARDAGARPVLVTPVARRTFQDGKPVTSLRPYADAVEKVGKGTSTPVVDLHAASLELFGRLGDDGSADLSASKADRTHFSRKGALAMARLVAEALSQTVPDLKEHLKR